MMNKTNQETKLLAIAVTIAAVAAGLAASLTTTQIADAYVGGFGGGCSERPDGTLYCAGGSGINDNPGFVEEGGDGPGGSGGYNTVDPETGEGTGSGGGSTYVGQPSQDDHKEGYGGHCVTATGCVGNER